MNSKNVTSQICDDQKERRASERLVMEWQRICARCDLVLAITYLLINTSLSVGLVLYYKK